MKDNADIEVSERLEQVESQAYDNAQHVGKKARIEKVTTHKTDRFEGKTSYYVKVETEVLDELDNEQKTQIRASRIFGLTRTQDGKLGWTEKSKLARMLRKHGVNHPQELVGKEVIIMLTDPNDEGFQYCTF